ncbi:hypothetical protein ACOME3_002816 [Neoechinorhynchus agilis]
MENEALNRELTSKRMEVHQRVGSEEQQEEIDAIQWNVEEFIQRFKNDESIVFGGKGFITEDTPDDEIELAIEAALASNETYKYDFCVESDGSIVPTTNI